MYLILCQIYFTIFCQEFQGYCKKAQVVVCFGAKRGNMQETASWLTNFLNTPFPLLSFLASIIGILAIKILNDISKRLDSIDSKLRNLDSVVNQNTQRIAMIEGYLWKRLNEEK